MNKIKCLIFILPLAFPLMSCNSGIPTSVTWTIEAESEASLHTDLQNKFLEAEDNDTFIAAQGEDFARTVNDHPNPVKFAWKYKTDSSLKPTKTVLTLSEDSKMDKNVLTYETTSKSLDIYNLKIDTTYYYTVTLDYDGTKFTSEPAKKTITDKAIRNLYIDGVQNVRDLGGATTSYGRIKQGLLYRSAEFNPDAGSSTIFPSAVTEEGKKELVDTLGIKSDVDLRRTLDFASSKDEIGGITSSPLGSSVNWVSLPMYYGGMNVFTQNMNLENVKAFFEYLADESHYPAVFHCIRGTDRTGALAYALGALLGMEKKDLIKDYLFSDLANINSDPIKESDITGKGFYVYQIDQSEGDTLSDKAAHYLMNMVGVSLETITSIRNILIER